MPKIYSLFQNRYIKNLVGGRLAWALARRASEQRKLVARQENPLVPDDQTVFFFKRNEVYTERLVEFHIDGPDYYLKTSYKSY